MTRPVSDLTNFARLHHGLFRLDDAERLGLSQRAVSGLVDRGWCDRPVRGVYRVQGAPLTADQADLLAAWSAGARAVVSHRAAGRRWSLPGFDHAAPEVVRPHGQSHRGTAGRLHLTRVLPDAHVRQVDRIPVTSVARTLFDLASVCHPGLVERSVDVALQRRLCDLVAIQQAFFALARRGRKGTALMRQLLEARGQGYVPPASELERLARSVFATFGLPEPEFEVDLGDVEWIGRVDCVWRRSRLIVELDGRRFHSGFRADSDRQRDNRLTAAGWRVIRVTWDDLVHRPEEVIKLIRRALTAAAS